jgi:hypothetical protein
LVVVARWSGYKLGIKHSLELGRVGSVYEPNKEACTQSAWRWLAWDRPLGRGGHSHPSKHAPGDQTPMNCIESSSTSKSPALAICLVHVNVHMYWWADHASGALKKHKKETGIRYSLERW